MRRFGYLGLCLIVSIALAMGLGCDSSSGEGDGGGTQAPVADTGYTQADLAGRWTLTGPVATATLKFDDQGRMVRYSNVNGLVGPWIGEITVAPDGTMKGNVGLQENPNVWFLYAFNDLRFRSKYRISGVLLVYMYVQNNGRGLIMSGPAVINRPVPK